MRCVWQRQCVAAAESAAARASLRHQQRRNVHTERSHSHGRSYHQIIGHPHALQFALHRITSCHVVSHRVSCRRFVVAPAPNARSHNGVSTANRPRAWPAKCMARRQVNSPCPAAHKYTTTSQASGRVGRRVEVGVGVRHRFTCTVV